MDDDVVFWPDCPSRAIIDQIANKWTILILAVLLDEPRRFNDIKRRIEGITQRVPTQNLRRLERSGMITRSSAASPSPDTAVAAVRAGAPAGKEPVGDAAGGRPPGRARTPALSVAGERARRRLRST